MVKKKSKTKKTKIEQQEKEFIPGTETEEQFEKVLTLLSQWIKAGIVSVKVDVDGDVNFELPKEMDKLLETQVPKDLTHKKVTGIIRSEIPQLITAGFGKEKEQILAFGMHEKLNINNMLKRSEKAVACLVDKNLKERIMLRRTTPGYILDEIQSIESSYRVESKKGEQVDIKFISLEFFLAKPRSGQMVEFNPMERTMRIARKDDFRVTVELHKDDIKDLIKKLSEIEEKINNKGD